MEIRDIGKDNPFSMRDGVIFKHPSQLYFFCALTFLKQYNWFYRITPRKFKVHRSTHQYGMLALSIYLPYRYSKHVNTVLFQLTKSKSSIVNLMVRLPSKVLIYGTSILIGQMVARMYWFYKRSFNATKQATVNTYLAYKVYSNGKKYPHFLAFQEIRPKLIA